MNVLTSLNRCFFVLFYFVGSVCAGEFVKEDVISDFSERLNSQMIELSTQLKLHQEKYPDAKNVVVLGKTGAGKSTLITYLAGKTLEVVDGDDGFYLTSASSVGNVKIGHDLGVGTERITPFFDSLSGVIYWDCPGFDDPRGVLHETQNAILIQQLFKSLNYLKVLVVVKEQDIKGRATEFWKLLKKMDVFAEQASQLYQCVSLVVTQQRDITNMRKRFGDLQNSENEYLENSIVKGLIDLFVDSTNTRVSPFAFPSNVGVYDQQNREGILSNLRYVSYADSLACHVALSLESQEYVRKLAADYNKQICEFVVIETTVAIRDAVYDQILRAISVQGQVDAPTAEQLKESFGGYFARLVSLDAKTYADGLRSLLEELSVGESVVNDSRFNLFGALTIFSDLLDEQLSATNMWGDALTETVNELQRLSMVETKKLINKQGDPYEVGDWIWKRDEFHKEGRGFKVKNIRRQFWSKKLESLALIQNITQFTNSLTLVEPEKAEIVGCGETEPRER